MINQIEKARQLFRSLEMRNQRSSVETAMRFICIQELLRDLKRPSIC